MNEISPEYVEGLEENAVTYQHIIEDLKSKVECHRQRIAELEAKSDGRRRKLPDTREGVTHHFTIHAMEDGKPMDYDGYLTVSTYPDTGLVGEVFLKMSNQGSAVSGFCDSWAIAMSMLLQTGTPLADLCAKYKHMRFEPSGCTGNKDVPVALSPVDYVAKYLERRFVK